MFERKKVYTAEIENGFAGIANRYSEWCVMNRDATSFSFLISAPPKESLPTAKRQVYHQIAHRASISWVIFWPEASNTSSRWSFGQQGLRLEKAFSELQQRHHSVLFNMSRLPYRSEAFVLIVTLIPILDIWTLKQPMAIIDINLMAVAFIGRQHKVFSHLTE